MDRNAEDWLDAGTLSRSLSARRAWIEMCPGKIWSTAFAVALRKESVDRNNAMKIVVVIVHASLSARRAWIEIDFTGSAWVPEFVALRKESVDRNFT